MRRTPASLVRWVECARIVLGLLTCAPALFSQVSAQAPSLPAPRIVEGQLLCGNDSLRFASSESPALSSASARQQELARLSSSVESALRACAAQPGFSAGYSEGADRCTPGCARIQHALAARSRLGAEAWQPPTTRGVRLGASELRARERALALDAELLEAALVVQAELPLAPEPGSDATALTSLLASWRQALQAEAQHAAESDRLCATVDLYVGPDGMILLREPDAPVRSLCIATRRFSTFEALRYDLRGRTAQRAGAAWPSEPTELSTPLPGNEAATLFVWAHVPASELLPSARQLGLLRADEAELIEQERLLKQAEAAQAERRDVQRALRLLAESVPPCFAGQYADEIVAQRAALRQLLLAAHPEPAALAQARRGLTELLGALARELQAWQLGTSRCDTGESASRELRAAAYAAALQRLPSMPVAELLSLQTALNELDAFASHLAEDGEDPAGDGVTELGSRRARLDAQLRRVCELAAQPLLVIAEDGARRAGEQSVEYDFASGFRGGTASSNRVQEGQPLLVRVQHVPLDEALRVELNGQAVSQSRAWSVGGSAALRERFALPATRVLELPPLEAGRSHELTLCTQPALRSAGCSSGDASVRVLGKHRLLVHGRRAAGVRFGLGAVAFPRPGTRLVRQPGGDGGMELWQVQQRSASLAAALPVLVAWYPWGRDPSARADLDLSLSLGLDVLAPTRRFIPLGVNLDFAGVGVSAGVTLERSRPASVRAGRLLLAAAGEPPELESSYGTHASARWGATLALSADWDTLHGAWQRLFLPELPVLGRGEP